MKRVKQVPDAFGYSLTLEHSLSELEPTNPRRPGKWAGYAGSFKNPRNVKKAIEWACKRIVRELNQNATIDDRLQEIIDHDLQRIHSCADDLGKKDSAQNDCIGALLFLVAHIVGFDKGYIRRQLLYVQSKEQQRSQIKYYDHEYSCNERLEIIRQLREKGNDTQRIALILNLSEYTTKTYIKRLEEREPS